jgi:DNA-binding Xre family transcriptional regulator
MKKNTQCQVHFVVENLVKIMNEKKLTKTAFAELVGFRESKWNKITNGVQRLDVTELSEIAEKLQMREIDIYTYPDIYTANNLDSDVKAQLTIELKEGMKEKVLSLVFGVKRLEMLNE